MIWEFLKKRWFSVALVALIVMAIVRKNIRFDVGGASAPAKKVQPEIYTKDASVAQSTTMLHLAGDAIPTANRLPAIDDATAMAFLKRFRQVARTEQQKFGMPASVLLACTYVNSFAGQRDCAAQANNYLGVRCTAEWSGPVVTIAGTCYRKYNTPWESIRDFNVYLSGHNWYGQLKKSARHDWKAWAKALAGHQASDVENFERDLGAVIQKYRLYELDR